MYKIVPVLTRKGHDCSGIAFIQGDSGGGSKLIEQTILNVYFDIICADVVYPPGEKLSIFTYFCSNQRFS